MFATRHREWASVAPKAGIKVPLAHGGWENLVIPCGGRIGVAGKGFELVKTNLRSVRRPSNCAAQKAEFIRQVS